MDTATRKVKPLKDRISYRTRAAYNAPMDSGLNYKYLNTFVPLPWQLDAMRDLGPVVLLTGSQGGGKSRTAAEKIHGFCLRYPGAQALVMRKVRDNVTASSMRMLEKKVIGDDPRVNFLKKDLRADYLNGSTIYFAGMHGEKQREAIRSIGEGSIDIAWMEEAHEFEEDDYEELIGRMRGAVAPWNQIILTTNPDSPVHWIHTRLILGEEAAVHYSSARDNPYNHEIYLSRLDNMTGSKGKRLRDGLWVQAAGMVLETWLDNHVLKDPDKGPGNVVEDAEYIDGLPVWIFCDDGYAGTYIKKSRTFTAKSHPRVFLLAQVRPDGQVSVFAESYKIKMQKAAHLDLVAQMCDDNGWARPYSAVYDSAAPSLGAALRSSNVVDGASKSANARKWSGVRHAFAGTKKMDDSVSVLRDTLAPDYNKWRGIIVHPRCRLFRFDMATWSYDKKGGYGKTFDHGPDAIRYGVYYLHDPESSESDIEISDSDHEMDALMDDIDKLWDENFTSVGIHL